MDISDSVDYALYSVHSSAWIIRIILDDVDVFDKICQLLILL